jgi:hypothetical protein
MGCGRLSQKGFPEMVSSPELPDNDGPVTPEELGLPPDYNPQFIPKLSELKRAAVEALDRETTFLMLHHEEPEKIVERLDKMAAVALAACKIEGEHQVKAIKLGLELRQEYWMAANKLDAWVDLIMPMLKTALEIKDRELQSRLYHAWSVYLYVARDRASAVQNALESASDYADDSGRADLKLLVRVERLNANVLKMNLSDVQAEAAAILAEAKQTRYDYVQARAYLLLGRAFSSKALYKEAFSYAQQALLLFTSIHVMALAGEGVILMLGSLNYRPGYSSTYRALLMDYLETLSRHTANNPILAAAQAYFQGVEYYHLEHYDRAREFILRARERYVMAHYRPSLRRCAHMLGLIQTKRRRWEIAAWHLSTARTYYEKVGEKTNAVQTEYALASIPFEQQDWSTARSELVAARAAVLKLPDGAVRDRLISLIEADITEAERHLT